MKKIKISEPKKSHGEPIIKRPFKSAPVDPYENIFSKIKEDHRIFQDHLSSIDTEIAKLQEERVLCVSQNLKVVALFKAAEQFNIKDIVTNKILETNNYKSSSKINQELEKYLNVESLPEHVKSELKEVLLSSGVISNNLGYRFDTTDSAFYCDDDED